MGRVGLRLAWWVGRGVVVVGEGGGDVVRGELREG